MGVEDFIGDVYETVPEHLEPSKLKTDFKPWHKPRKQWLRKHQWLHEIQRLNDTIRFSGSRPLRYMSLPGTDFLDVRYIHGWCLANEIPLMFLGYNEPTSTDPNQSEMSLSLAELTQRNYVDRNSNVVPDKIERISSQKSVAYLRMMENGPFDIVNLDLCNSIAACVPQDKQDDYYKALYEIVAYQKKSRTEPWLLFITTRTNHGSVNDAAGTRLFSCVESNAVENDDFKKKVVDELEIDFEKVRECYGTGSTKSIDADSFHKIFALGLSKWLLKLLFSGAPKWRLELLPSYDYTVYPARTTPDMISFGFLCSMITERPIDQAGLTPFNSQPAAVSFREPDIAISLVDSLSNLKCVDQILTDSDTKRVMIEESALLMSDARYNRTAYQAWAVAL